MTNETDDLNRIDYKVILDLIDADSKVLDLGCGDGELLSLLFKYKNCSGTGIEIDEKAIYQCIAKGLTVLHEDIDSGLRDYSDKRFDYVILNESLQQVLHPKNTILEALRIGKKAIVGVPNFCHITSRLQIFFRGKVPITQELPYEWYETPNLRFFSLKDFRSFCEVHNIKIVDEKAIGLNREVNFLPNLFAYEAIFLLER